MKRIRRRAIFFALLAALLAASAAEAQVRPEPKARLRLGARPRGERFEVEAFAGQPFGVGRVVVELPEAMLPEPLGIEGLGLRERDGRVLYPAIDSPEFANRMKELIDAGTPLTAGGPVREEVAGLLRGILDRPPRTTLYFLFRGDEPLALSLEARSSIPLPDVRPVADPGAHGRLLQLWWNQYVKPASLLQPKSDYPPAADNFLASTLARRLNLRLPSDKQTPSAHAELRRELGFNLGTESLRLSMQQDRILGLHNLGLPCDQPLPPAYEPPPAEVPEPPAEVAVEPIALRVPAECFYVRFGRFNNFLWLQDTLAKWGGDAQNLIALRGIDRGMSERIEKQLALKQTVLSRMLGETVIADVALIGADMFFREGASYGLLFQARNNFLLGTNFAQQRAERVKAGGVAEETIEIGGRKVSYLSSPDGKVRSYYVAYGDFHCIAASRDLVARFLATASGQGALGSMPAFRHARTLMPADRGDVVWAYLSEAFFRNVTSPHYRVEMARRLQAAADIELVQLAKLAAACEGRPGETIEQLIAGGLLPAGFGPIPGGSRAVVEAGEVRDSLRGRLGAFVPVGDVPVENVTAAERAEYERFVEFFRQQWGHLDPIVAGIQRFPLDGGRERIVLDVRATPFAPQHFQTLKQWLGPADDRRLAPIPGDLAAFELTLPEQRVFGGLCDVGLGPNAAFPGRLPLGRLRDFFVGYVGTTGPLGILGVLNLGIPPYSDPAGFAQSPLNGWRRQYDVFTVFSFQREVLETVVPQLRFEPAERPAQVRLRIDDVSRARIAPRLNDLAYARTRETSLNNLRFLHVLDQQLHVPAASCLEAAEFLLDAKLICPLGGRYELRKSEDSPPRWTSTALQPGQPGGLFQARAPEGFQAPPMNWFRGLDLDATATENAASIHAEIIMQMPP